MKIPSNIVVGCAALVLVGGGLAAAWVQAHATDQPATARPGTVQAVQAISTATLQDEDDGKVRTLKDFMRQKLKASNQILEGLMVDDMQMIDKAADTLLRMGKAEHWRASNDMMYLQHSREFMTTVEDMQKKARKDSLDGTSLAWINVTMKCIQCHEWVRNTIIADAGLNERTDRLALNGFGPLTATGDGSH